MKIRWTQNSLRLRISLEELTTLQAGGTIEETLQAPPRGSWKATLQIGDGETSLTGEDSTLRVCLSSADGVLLAEPEREGVYFTQSDPPLRYYVEKDLPCTHEKAGG